MKTRIILLLAISAVVTLSFTFAAKTEKVNDIQPSAKTLDSEPIGGFVSEDKL